VASARGFELGSFSRHFLRYPESHAASDKPQPDDKIVFSRTMKAGHAFAYQARVDEEGGDPGYWMVLVGEWALVGHVDQRYPEPKDELEL
jgi:hypothetical protein